MEPYQISVNHDQYACSLAPEAAQNLDFVPNGDGKFHILKNEKSYQAELISADFEARSMQIRVNGRQYSVHIADQYERLLKQLGLTVGGVQKMNVVKAPMPGLVLQILVEPGQKVEKGDPLLILEAMKMENMLKATGEGTVKIIKITKGQAVEKGELLLEMA